MNSLDNDSFIFLLFYVDDILIPVKSMNEVNNLKTLLIKEFDMKDLDVVKKIFPIEIRRDKASRRFWLSQCSYIEGVGEIQYG